MKINKKILQMLSLSMLGMTITSCDNGNAKIVNEVRGEEKYNPEEQKLLDLVNELSSLKKSTQGHQKSFLSFSTYQITKEKRL